MNPLQTLLYFEQPYKHDLFYINTGNYKNIYFINTCVNTEFKIVKTTIVVNNKTKINRQQN